MTSRQRMFNVMYRLGFAPWDGHELAQSLRDLVESDTALTAGTALDVGCGTGDNSIYLAKHGWRVTGVDFVAKAVTKARAKAAAEKVDATFAQANATRLSSEGIGAGFDLIIDSGCLHGMSATDRDAYVGEVTAVAAPGAHLHMMAFVPGAMFGVPGIDSDEAQRRFEADWTLLASGREQTMDPDGKDRAQYYLFVRRS